MDASAATVAVEGMIDDSECGTCEHHEDSHLITSKFSIELNGVRVLVNLRGICLESGCHCKRFELPTMMGWPAPWRNDA